jgi:multisubunit Na+/H+ antiporter MnhB subunit
MIRGFEKVIIVAISVTLVILSFGILCVRRPERAIEMQKKFYEKINWRLEPIVVKRELKNTRIMGIFMVVAGALTLLLIILRTMKK